MEQDSFFPPGPDNSMPGPGGKKILENIRS